MIIFLAAVVGIAIFGIVRTIVPESVIGDGWAIGVISVIVWSTVLVLEHFSVIGNIVGCV
jgi:hypothetical protein